MRTPLLLAAICAAAGLAVGAGSPARADVAAVELEDISFDEAHLVVVGRDGEVRYSPAELEGLGTYRMVTTTPWRKEPAVFEGTLLTDLLAAQGLEDVAAIRVTAENDYAVVIPREVWTLRPVLIATRVDGQAHTRRARGPLQFVFPMNDEPALDDQSFEANWVWMASRIEPAQ